MVCIAHCGNSCGSAITLRYLLKSICLLWMLAAAVTAMAQQVGDGGDAPDPPASVPGSTPVDAETAAELPAAGTIDLTGLTDEERAMVQAFIEVREVWVETLVEMRQVQIRFNNSVEKDPQSMVRFRELRNLAREQLKDLFAAGVRLFETRPGDFESGSFLATVLDYRKENSIYEDSFHAAKLLIDSEIPMTELYLVAARAAFIEGRFDEVLPMYEAYVAAEGPDKIEDVDKQFVGMLEPYRDWWAEEIERRQAETEADDLPRVLLETTCGPVVLELFEDQAPNTVAHFLRLVEEEFYDGLDFYQVISDLLAMGGDPIGDGTGTYGRFIPDEHERADSRRIFRGSIFMAKMPADTEGTSYVPDTASSQFIIALVPMAPRERTQTVFGRVIEGLDVVCSFRRVDPAKKKENEVVMPPDRILTARVVRKRDHDYEVKYVPAGGD